MAGKKEKEADNAPEIHPGPVSSEKTGHALKPKAKILKKSLHNNITKINTFKGTTQVRGRKGKMKGSVSDSKTERIIIEKEDEKKRDLSAMKQKSIAYEEHNNKSQQSHKTKEKLGGLQTKMENQNNNEKRSGLKKRKSLMDKEKHAELEMNQKKEKKAEKLGGLIFMCSAKTKPDCFHYRVMGVPISKKDLVLCVKPGLKLFLYDFELRLMYGIYKASSSGGMKLEPTAFSGAFPVQVRFNVHEDCYPLPENVFRKAIKDNYNGKQKFEMQLTVKQVKKLIELFQPVQLRSKPLAIQHQPTRRIQNREVVDRERESRRHSYSKPSAIDRYTYDDEVRRHTMLRHEDDQHIPYREVSLTEKEELHQDTFLTEKEYRTYGLRRERPNLTPPSAIDRQPYDEVRRYATLPHEDDRHIPYREVMLTEKEELHQNTFLTEAEYRTYGLRRERPNLTPPTSHMAPALEPYPKGHVSEDLMRHPTAIYMDIAPPRGESSRHQPLLVSEKDYQTYGVGTIHELQHYIPSVTAAAAASTLDSYPRYQHYSSLYGTLPVDPYPPPSRRDGVPSGSYTLSGSRETYPVETDDLPRKEIYLTETDHLSRRGNYLTHSEYLRRENDVERLYSTHASSMLTDYNRNHNSMGARPEPSHASVSSRYSFAGPSLSYR